MDISSPPETEPRADDASPAPREFLSRHTRQTLIQFLLLVLLLLGAGYLRFTGLTWGDYGYEHPDERFLIWVVADIAPVDSLSQYFDTATSTLNPVNRQHTFFVYGDFPVIVTRYVTEALFDQTGWMEILQTGRGLSAFLDLLTVLFVYLIAERLSGWKVATLAGLFSAGAVLQIQQAHFFTSDSFAVCFSTLVIYFGVLIVTARHDLSTRGLLYLCLGFGAAVGLAMACKINTAPVAVLLPVALLARYLRLPHDERAGLALRYTIALFAGGALAFLVFRVAMPYAFTGPGFINIWPDQKWIANLNELRAQSTGDVDFPPALQWARRSHLFSLQNMVLWGLGIPLGVMSWVGFFLFAAQAFVRSRRVLIKEPGWFGLLLRQSLPWFAAALLTVIGFVVLFPIYKSLGPVSDNPAGHIGILIACLVLGLIVYVSILVLRTRRAPSGPFGWFDRLSMRVLRGTFGGTLLVWGWTAFYFTWQSLAWNPTMRYQLPIYPTLAVLAAWGLGELWAHPPARVVRRASRGAAIRRWKVGVGVAGALVLLLTLAWAFAFTRMYNRTETRVAASHWIFENVPGPFNLQGSADGKAWTQLLPFNGQVMVRPGQPFDTWFTTSEQGVLSSIQLPRTNIVGRGTDSPLRLRASIFAPDAQAAPLSVTEITLPPAQTLDSLPMRVDGLPTLAAGKRYGLRLELFSEGSPSGVNPTDLGAFLQVEGQVSLGLYARAQTIPYNPQGAVGAVINLPAGGTLRQVRLPEGVNVASATVMLQNPQQGDQQSATAMLNGDPSENLALPQPGGPVVLRLEPPLTAKPGVNYQVLFVPLGADINPAAQSIQLDFLDDPITRTLPALTPPGDAVNPLYLTFSAQNAGELTHLSMAHAVQVDPAVTAPVDVVARLFDANAPYVVTSEAHARLAPLNGTDPRGGALTFTFDPPVRLAKGVVYNMSVAPERGALAVRGSAVANETDWDMGLPFRMDGYDPFGGIYNGDLNFDMYGDDNPDKLQRFINTLNQADYVFMSSNRQWGTTTRLPERYPLTTTYYRDLLGCPPEKTVIWCYNVAEPGMFQGKLGFELVKTFTSYPNLGPIQFNTQFAEEAFTVYDHPKVMIFQKSADYDPTHTAALLNAVDLRNIVHTTPKKAADFKSLLLTPAQAVVQQAGGTWAKLFPPDGLLNRAPWLAALVYYLFIFLLGALVYPIVRLALPGLRDGGYPLARTAGMVLLAYLAWISGSAGITVTRGLLLGIFILIAAAGIGLGLLQRRELAQEWHTRRGYFLTVELVALALFTIELLIRLGNPDLWHPIYGGEKPMDFSFFNAVLKSSIFPPYDPWFGGGYINYYYYGYVLVGMPIKLLGINPSVAYNLVLPGLFSLVGLGAFSIGWNLLEEKKTRGLEDWEIGKEGSSEVGDLEIREEEDEAGGEVAKPIPQKVRRGVTPLAAGLMAVLALLILGNLGTMRMYWQGFQKLVVPDEEMAQGSLVQHFTWFGQGVGKMLSHEATALPYYPGDWYWKPSRAIQPESGNEITEFPMFTFIYADLHAHLIALPVTLLVLAWALALILGRGRWGIRGPDDEIRAGGRLGWLSFGLALLLGALAAGSLRPANTWDQYTYLTIAALALFYAMFRADGYSENTSLWLRDRWLRAIIPAALLVLLAVLFYAPFDKYFAQGYNSLELWKGARTGLSSYLVHWGLFLFVISAWLFDETVDWLAHTPLGKLNALRPYRAAIVAAASALLVLLIALLGMGVQIALVAVPLGILASLLLFRPGQSDAKRAVLFMIGTALVLTLAVELVAVKGDIGRMNTVFKFYYQAWTLLAISAAAGLAWLLPKLAQWHPGWRTVWNAALALLVFSAAMFPLTATRAKITDRMVNDAPHTLDGMEYMNYATYTDGQTDQTSKEMDLSQDYRAIRWAQANIPGSPIIVEANTPEYRHWGTRFTIYTGLPGVVGWNWHERQQRTVTPDTWVFERIDDINSFYMTTSPEQAAEFLRRYNVQYIIFGQIEQIWYAGPGLAKFAEQNGKLWDEIYAEGATKIYKVRGAGE